MKNDDSFSKQIDDVLSGKYNRFDALKVCDTPRIFLDAGLQQLPILYTQNHLKDALHEKSSDNPHWHGLSIEQIKKVPKLLESPVLLMDSLNNDDSIVAVLSLLDNDNAPVFATIKPNGNGIYNSHKTDSNFMLSIYGKEKGFEYYIKRAVEENKILYWNKEKSQEIQCAELLMAQGLDSLDSNKILHQTNSLVNKTTSTLVIDSNQAARIKAAREIKENMPNLSENERTAAVAILEAGAKSQKMSISEYMEKTFPNGIFGDIKKAENAAKQQGVEINGAVSINGFGENAKAVIYAGKTADFSTWCHELSHVWQSQLTGELKQNAEEAFQVKNSDWQNSVYTFQDGHTDTSAEAFAYGFEDFLKHKAGEMSTEEKKKIFEKFSDYMSRTYNGVKQHIKINEKITSVYQKLIDLDGNILAQAEKAVREESENEFLQREKNIQHSERREDYIKKYYTNIKNQYYETEQISSDGKRKGIIEVSNDRNLNNKTTRTEIDALLTFTDMGAYATLLSESPRIGDEKHIDALLNHRTLVEIKSPTGNANSIAKEIKEAINKENSELVTVFLLDSAKNVSDDEILEKLEQKRKFIHGNTDGIFVIRNGIISEIKIPRVESFQTRSPSNSNNITNAKNVNISFQPVDSSTLFQFQIIGELGARELDRNAESNERIANLKMSDNTEQTETSKTRSEYLQGKTETLEHIEEATDSQSDSGYIHSEEFISKFGDWEKAKRLEKLIKSESVQITGTEIAYSDNIKEYKKNAIQYGKNLRGEYENLDSGKHIILTSGKKNGGIYEILEHDYKDKDHLQSIAAIPQIIEKSIYISSQKNEDTKKHPNIERYEYYLCGLKIENKDYTVKAVVAKTLDGKRYYDHKLTDIEKGQLIESLKKYSVQKSSVSITTQTPDNERFQLKDKRLYQICQCPQSIYLDEKLEPSQETVQAVKTGKLYLEKDENGIEIIHDETEYHLKEIRSFASERPLVVRGGTQSIPSSTTVNIDGKNNSVNDVSNSLLSRDEISMLRKHSELKDSETRFQTALNLLEAKTRSEYLQGKTELSDVDIINILDLPVEKRSINNEIYTDKSYKELKNNPEELSSLTENLKTKPEYLKYHSSYIAKSKLLYQESDVLCNEIPCLIVLAQLKKTSYLLPYEYAANKSGAAITSADALKSNTFTDFKRVFNKNLRHPLEKGSKQGRDIFFLLNNENIDYKSSRKQLEDFVNSRKLENKEAEYLFFSEKDFVCYSFVVNENGLIKENPSYDLKQIRLANVDKPLIPNQKTDIESASSSDNINITQKNSDVNDLKEIRAAIPSKPLTPSRESEKTSDSLASNLNITQENSDVNDLKQIRLANIGKPLHPTRSQTEMSATSSDNIDLPQNKSAVNDLKEIRAAISSKPLTPNQKTDVKSVSSSSEINITQENSDVNKSENELFNSLLLRGEISSLEILKDIENRQQRYFAAVKSLEKLNASIHSETIKKSNSKFIEKECSSKFFKSLVNTQRIVSESQKVNNTYVKKSGLAPLDKPSFAETIPNKINIPSTNETIKPESNTVNKLYKKNKALIADTADIAPQDQIVMFDESTSESRDIENTNEEENMPISTEKDFTKDFTNKNETENQNIEPSKQERSKFDNELINEANLNKISSKPDMQIGKTSISSELLSFPVEPQLSIGSRAKHILLQNDVEHQAVIKKLNQNIEPSKTEFSNYDSQEYQQKKLTTQMILDQEDKEQMENISATMKSATKDFMDLNATPITEIPFTKENYDKLFPFGIVQTPVEKVKLGEHQFEKLDVKNRGRFLLASYQTLAIPDIVIDELKEGRHSHNYVKSFVFDDKTKTIQDIVVNINGENISISAHPREVNNVLNKIKTPDQLVYAAAEVGRMIEQRVQNELGIVNPTRVDRLSTISVPLNKEYSMENALSTINEAAENSVVDEKGNTHYQNTEERIDFLKTPTGNKSELSENEWKFSHSSEFKELYGDWEGKIKKDFLLNDDTVSKLTGDEFSRKEGFTLTEQVEQYFNETNNSVESPFFGKVVLDREGADDSLSHEKGRLKAVAYAGVPNVIKNGVIIDSDLNHKDRGYNSYVIAAPIKIADKNYICEVVLKQNKQENRFYLHEVTEQKKFLERAFVTNPAQKPAHQGTLSNILEKTVSVNYEISCPMGINGEPEKTFVQNEYRKSLNEVQSKNQNTATKITDSVKQEENPFNNADPDQIKELYEQAEAVEKMQQEAAENAVLDENGNTHYQTDEDLLQEYKQKYPESSLSISENTRIELENVFSQIDDYLDKGIIPQESRFTLPKVPPYLKELGSDETAISLPVSVIKKARETHGLSNEEIKKSLTRLYDPVAVFDTDKTKSENKVDSKLILTDEFSESKPIALALNTNTQIQVEEDGHRKLIEVQDIRSIHDRTLTAKNGTDLVKHWTENGLCRYVDDKKISEWSTVARVSFPIEALHSDKNNILIKSEVVNSHNSDSVSQEENPSVQMEPRLMKKFDEMKKAIEDREKQEGQNAAEKTESAGSKKAESHEKQKVDLIKKAAKDFISAIKNGTAPFLNTIENDFGKILLHPAAIVNASNGLPFSGEAQLLAQIYHQQQKMEGEIVTTFEGAKESGTFIADKPESKKNFVLANKTEQQQKEIIQKTRYFMPEACSEPDKIYAHALQMQRPQKISDYRDLIRHFENIPNGQKEISDLRIRIAHEHLKEIQSRFALKEKRILTVDEINERKKILQDYFKNLPEKHRESEKSAFENTFGLTLNPEEVFKTNLEGNFKNKKFEDVVKSNEKLTDQANRRLSAFIQNNSMEDKKLSEILHEEYNEQLKEEKSTSKKLKIEAKGITEPETYLGKYLAACSSNAEFVTDEDTIKAVQANLVKKLEENYRLEKYGILKEIGQQAQKISNETTSKIAFDKAHSNKNIKEKNIAKEIGPVGMGN